MHRSALGKFWFGSGREVCYGPSRPDPGRNAREQDGTRTGRDGPHLGTWMGPKCWKTKHMANLDGTPSDPGWDLDVLRGRHLSVLNLKFDFISDGGRTREKQIALSLKRHLFPHGGRESKAFWICFSRVHPPSEIKSNFKFKTLKRHLLKRHLTRGNPKGGLAKGGLARKAPIGPKRALSGQFLLFRCGCGVRRNWSRSAPKRPR